MTTLTEIAAPTYLLRIADLTPAQIEHLLDLAAQMKANPYMWIETLRGQSLACFFEKPSTRTRVSFAAAAYRLGMQPIMLRPDELQLGRGEPIGDTARVLSSYASAEDCLGAVRGVTSGELVACSPACSIARRAPNYVKNAHWWAQKASL